LATSPIGAPESYAADRIGSHVVNYPVVWICVLHSLFKVGNPRTFVNRSKRLDQRYRCDRQVLREA